MKSFPNQFKNILLIRTDRMGDVVLTTPVISALKKSYPDARISFLLTPDTKQLIEGNPYVDEVIVYDRKKDRGFIPYWKFVLGLRKRKFDLALVFHTKKRINLIAFLAGITWRIGYKNEKFGFLLNFGMKDTRALGVKHEVEYCLDVVRALGKNVESQELLIPTIENSEIWAETFLANQGVVASDRVIAVHPGASCLSKRWPPKSFSELINQIQAKYPVKIMLVGGEDIEPIIHEMRPALKYPIIDSTGKTSLSQLASLFRRSRLLISNDSGPVHLASGVGIPVLAIFGRNQAGLNPKRWRPLSKDSRVVHKDVGCVVCLAHNCVIDFKCLKELTVPEVLEAFDAIYRLW